VLIGFGFVGLSGKSDIDHGVRVGRSPYRDGNTSLKNHPVTDDRRDLQIVGKAQHGGTQHDERRRKDRPYRWFRCYNKSGPIHADLPLIVY
jgi:hypothetical protein